MPTVPLYLRVDYDPEHFQPERLVREIQQAFEGGFAYGPHSQVDPPQVKIVPAPPGGED